MGIYLAVGDNENYGDIGMIKIASIQVKEKRKEFS